MESCGSAHSWARQMMELGHKVRLIAPQYVRPFVKRQKNDAADAEAMVIAAPRPEMRFVEPKSELQQAKAVLFRARECLVHQRTELVNALHAVLYEYGHTIPQGIVHLKRIEALLDEPNTCRVWSVRNAGTFWRKSARRQFGSKPNEEDQGHGGRNGCDTTVAVSGIGPITALAVEAFAPTMASFKPGRDSAAWLGLAPRQHSTCGKERLGRVSKPGRSTPRQVADHRRNVAVELARAQVHP